MTSQPQQRGRTFTLSNVEVFADVDIDEDELRDAGWVYVGRESTPWQIHDGALGRVERWHNEQHEGPWPWCTHELCADLQRMARP